MATPRQGEIWAAMFRSGEGHEQTGVRPVLIVSNDAFNDYANGLVIIAPITTRNRGLALQPLVMAPEGGLRQDSVVMCDQVRSIAVSRLRSRRGEVGEMTLQAVLDALDAIFRPIILDHPLPTSAG